MTRPVFQQAGEGKAANVTELSSIGIILFLYSVSFFGLFIVVIFRKSMITGNKLPYPSGTATAELINIFHVPQDAKLVLKQVRVLILSSFMSLMWSCFKWFLAAGNGCGFDYFPTFGLTAYKQRLYFNSSGAYVGLGMMSPYEISLSYLVGAFFSWAFLWLLLGAQKGLCFDANLSDTNWHGLQGYKVSRKVQGTFGYDPW